MQVMKVTFWEHESLDLHLAQLGGGGGDLP
jgi:hypothetical protein